MYEHHRESRHERREALQEQHNNGGGFGGFQDDRERYDDGHGRGAGRGLARGRGHGGQGGYGREEYESHQYRPDRDEDPYGPRRPRGYEQGQGQGYGGGGYTPPSGPPPGRTSGFASQGGLDRGDFASDADIDRMVTSGELGGRPAWRQDQRNDRDDQGGYGEFDSAGRGGGAGGGRYDAPGGPPPGQGYSSSRYDAPSGPPPGRDYQRQEPRHQEYGSGGGGGGYGSNYCTGPDRPSQYGSQQGQGRPQYDSPQSGRGQSNAPSGGFTASRDDDSGYGGGGRGGRDDEPMRRGEAAGYYDQQSAGRGDRYDHLAGMAQEHGDDPEAYRQATQGLHEKIQSQTQNRPPGGDANDNYQSHVDAHRKAYGGDDHGPMDVDTIGAAAAMEAIKQTAAAGNKPLGGFSGGSSSKPGPAAGQEATEDAEDDSAAAGGRGMQDKLMALAMSHAGKLFDKKNAGSNAGSSDTSGGDKAQAMQSAAATAMQLFSQYQSKGKLDAGDMTMVMQLAKNLF